MKKLILAATILAVVGLNLQTAKAGDREWATVGKVLTGVAAVNVLANVLDVHPHYASTYTTYSEPVYCPPPRVVYYRPAPIVYREPVCYAPRVVSYRDRDYRGHEDRRDDRRDDRREYRGDSRGDRDGFRSGYRR